MKAVLQAYRSTTNISLSSTTSAWLIAKVYNADKKEIASTIEFNSSEQEEYTAQTLKFEYNKEHMQSKAKYITVFFQSGYDTTISNMHRENGGYGSSPFGEDRVVGSVLKIDNVVLNYDYE